MPGLLNIDERIKLQESCGCKLLSRISAATEVTRSSAPGTVSAPLPDPEITSGVYRIVQSRWVGGANAEDVDASIPAIAPTAPTDILPVTMEPPALIGDSNLWRITRAYGADHGYFVVPNYTPGALTGLGGTTFDNEGDLIVKRSSSYPVWKLRCDERVTYRKEDGTFEDKYYFRILAIGTTQCWRTTADFQLKVEPTSDASRHDQLYELVRYIPRQDFVIQSHQPIAVSANSATLERKLWVASGQLASHDLARLISVQIATDARDQGWASNPELGVWTWFELCVLTGPTSPDAFSEADIKRGADGGLLTYYSHSTNLSNEYQEQTGKLFGRDAEIWRHVEAGNLIGVLACAQFRAWKLDGRSAKLTFQQLVPQCRN